MTSRIFLSLKNEMIPVKIHFEFQSFSKTEMSAAHTLQPYSTAGS